MDSSKILQLKCWVPRIRLIVGALVFVMAISGSSLFAQTTCATATWLVPEKSYQNDSRTSAGITTDELDDIISSSCTNTTTFSEGEKVMWHKVLGTGDEIALSFINNSSYSTFDAFNSFSYAVYTGTCGALSCVDIDAVSTGSRFLSEDGETYFIAVRIDNSPPMSSASPTAAMYDARVQIVPDFAIADQTVKVSKYASFGEVLLNVMPNSNLVDVDDFTIVSGNDEGIFGISGEEISIASESALQNTTETTVTLLIEAEDTDLPQTTQGTITIEIVDNHAPEAPIGPFGLMIDENAAAYTTVGSVAATDTEGDALTYEMENILLPFYISSTGNIITKLPLNYEDQSSYTFNVIATQESPIELSTTYEVTVDINDIDETGDVVFQQYVLDINAGSNYTLGSFSVTDEDGYADALTITDVSPQEDFVDGDEFEVSGTSLDVVAIDDVRDSGAKTYQLTVEGDVGGVNAGTLNVVRPGSGIPAIAYYNGHQVDEDATSGYLTGISVYDSDVAAGDLSLILSTMDGLLTSDELTDITFSVGDGADDSDMTMTGTMTALNNFLAKLKFTPTADFSGTAEVSITVEDASTNSASETFSIEVTPVNDPVSITAPAFVSVNEDSSGGINALSSSISLSDADESTSLITDPAGGYYGEIAVGHGEVQLLSAGALNFFQTFTGRGQYIYFMSSINNINNTLSNPLVRYLPEADYSGPDYIELTFTNTADASDVATAIIPVYVTNVNDQPFISAVGDVTEVSGTDVIDLNDGDDPVELSVDEVSELTFVVTAVDDDNDLSELTFDLDQASKDAGMQIDNSGNFSWTPDEADGDIDFEVTISVSDGNLSDDVPVLIVVNEVPNVWNGSVWSDGIAPAAGEGAQLDGDFTFSTDGTFEANNLEISTGVTLTVDNESTLVVSDALTNNGNIDIASGSSLITYAAGSFTGNDITVHRTTRYADGKYSFVGTPVQPSASITEVDLGDHVYIYDESEAYGMNDGLERWKPHSGELVPGVGYTQAGQQDLEFVGKPNVGTISFTGSYTEDVDDAYEGWAFVANPYTAAISVADFLTENTNIAGAVYIWDDNGSDAGRGTNADYIVANGTMTTNSIPTPAGGESRYNQHLGSAQGFFVKLNGNTDIQIDFTEAMREGGQNADDNFFRKSPMPILRVNLTNEDGLFKQTVIGLTDEGSEYELNRTYDAPAFNNKSESGIFTQKLDRVLSLNGMPHHWESIDLQVNTASVKVHTISLESEHFNGSVYLRDNQLNHIIDLAAESYHFTPTAGISSDRFQLLSSPNAVLEIDEKSPLIYAYERTLVICAEEGAEENYTLVNVNGQVVKRIATTGGSEIDLSALPEGVYIVLSANTATKIMLK